MFVFAGRIVVWINGITTAKPFKQIYEFKYIGTVEYDGTLKHTHTHILLWCAQKAFAGRVSQTNAAHHKIYKSFCELGLILFESSAAPAIHQNHSSYGCHISCIAVYTLHWHLFQLFDHYYLDCHLVLSINELHARKNEIITCMAIAHANCKWIWFDLFQNKVTIGKY